MKDDVVQKVDSIVIRLGELGKTKPLPPQELIYGDSIEDFKKTICNIVRDNVEAIEREDGISVVHQPCFFVNGGRGSGKSTVLRALQRDLCFDDPKKGKMPMGLLASIDPTELAGTESFFVHILGRVQKLLQDSKDNSFINEKKRSLLKQAYDCIQTMSRGLGLLMRRAENSDTAEDANYYVQESIAECVSSTRLKEKFSELMECLSGLYGVSAWLVTVDDADMNFKNCRDVFETARKYLFNPRMCFIFSGDLKLYIMVVRGMQIGHFGKMSLNHDIERQKDIFSLLDSLEDQYIMKLFPVENRMNLESFSYVLSLNPQICYPNAGDAVRVKDFLQNNLRKAHIEYDGKYIYDYMSTFSMRSALQLLAYWMKHIKQVGENDDAVRLREENLRHWCNGIARVVASRLIKHGVDGDRIGDNGLLGLIKSVLMHAKQINLGAIGANLVPGLGEETQQAVSFYLSAEVFRRVRSVSDIILYMLNLFPYLQKYGKDVPLDNKVYSHLYNNFDRQFGAECSSIVLSLNKDDRKPFAGGVIPLKLSSYFSSGRVLIRTSAEDCFSSLISTVKKEKTECAVLRFLALYHSLCYCKDKDVNVLCVSVYNLLFLIQRICDLENDAKLEENVREMLFESERFTQSLTVESEASVAGSKMKEVNSLSESTLKEFMAELGRLEVVEAIIAKIVQWVKCFKKEKEDGDMPVIYHCSASSLYRCWANFWNRCANITEEAKLYAHDKEDLVEAGRLLNFYMKAFSESLRDCLAVEIANSLDTCPLWVCLMSQDWLKSAMCKELNKVNIAPVELSYNLEKMEKTLSSQLEQSKKTVISRIEEKLSRLCQRSMEGFNNWCSQKVEDMKFRTITKKEFLDKIILGKPDKNEEEEIASEQKEYEHQLSNLISHHGLDYWLRAQAIKDKHYQMAIEMIHSEGELVEQRIRQKLKSVTREDKMLMVIISQLRRFEYNRGQASEKIEQPMIRALDEVELMMREVFVNALRKWEEESIKDK